MTAPPSRGDTFLIQTGGSTEAPDYHCFCVATGTLGDPPEILIVSFSSIREERVHDHTCILEPGDHPFIQKPSFVLYSKAQIVRVDEIIDGVRSNQIKPKPRLSDELLNRIILGFSESRDVAPRYLSFCLQDQAAS